MTLITNFPPLVLPPDGTEEYVVYFGGLEYKIAGADIFKVTTDDLAAYIISNDIVVASNTTGKVAIAGDTMTGALTLSGVPINALHASSKSYVDMGLSLKLDAATPALGASATATTAATADESTLVATTQFVSDRIKYDITQKTVISATPHSLLETERGVVYVDHLATAPTIINLPEITSLVDPEKVEFLIVDSLGNSEINSLIINAFAGETISGVNSVTITTNGESIHLGTAGGTSWIIHDKVTSSTETKEGVIRRATTAEAEAMVNTSVAMTPANVLEALEVTTYKNTEINVANSNFVGSDGGNYFITFAGARTIGLPAVAGLLTGIPFVKSQYTFTNLTATPGNTTVFTAAGGDTINGAASFTMPADMAAGVTFYPVATGWVSKNDTSTVLNTAAATSDLDSVLAAGNTTGGTNIVVTGGDDVVLDDGNVATSRVIWGSDNYITYDEGDDALLLLQTSRGFAVRHNAVDFVWESTTGVLAITRVTGEASIQLKNAASGFNATIIPTTLTASRAYTLPDASDTLAGLADIAASVAGYLNLTTGGTVVGGTTFNSDLNVGANYVGTKVSMLSTTDTFTLEVDNERTAGNSNAARFKSVTPSPNDNTALQLQAANGVINTALDIISGNIKTAGNIISSVAGAQAHSLEAGSWLSFNGTTDTSGIWDSGTGVAMYSSGNLSLGAFTGSDILLKDGPSTIASIRAGELDFTHAAMVIKAAPAGPGTGLTIGDTTLNYMAFYGATPVQQPTSSGETVGYAAVGGTNVDSNDTFNGNVGGTAYTMNDIVKHLKTLGFLRT